MARLTEQEIFSKMAEEFRLGAEDCEVLAKAPYRGAAYNSLRHRLLLIEGCIRQAGHWREDSRWFGYGLMLAEVHKRAGGWLRGYKVNGAHVSIAPGQLHPLFIKLAENLRAGHAKAEEFRTKATGRVGTLLPKVQAAPHRDTTPVGWRKSNSGILLPA